MTFEWLAYSPSEELVTLDRVVMLGPCHFKSSFVDVC